MNIQRKFEVATGTATTIQSTQVPARHAPAARQAREGHVVQDEGVQRQQHDQADLGLQLRVVEVVGALAEALDDDRAAGDVEQQQRQHDDAGDERVRRRDPDLVLGELREQPQVGRDDGAERHRSREQVSEDQEHVQQGNGFPGKGAAREIEP